VPDGHVLRLQELRAGLGALVLARQVHPERREPDPKDGRYTNAILTRAGLRLLTASAPAHVAKVRELVIDALSPAELRHLRTASERILERIEPSAG